MSSRRFADECPVYSARSDDLDRPLVQSFLESRKLGYRGRVNDDVLLNYRLLVRDQSTAYPSLGGLLLFGSNLERFFPEAFIVASHFSGVRGREAIASSDCSGPLFEQFERVYAFVTSRLSSSFSIRGKKRAEKLEIPVEAIREVLLNAIVHRDYRIPGPTKVAIFDDRIEIFSPGIFPGPLPLSELESGITYIRNTIIARVFREAGYIEKLGSGFITLFDSYRRAGLEKPVVIEGDNYIKCILPRGEKKKLAAGDDLAILLQCVQSRGSISPIDLRRELGWSRATLARRLQDLVKKKLVRRIGKGPSTKYSKR